MGWHAIKINQHLITVQTNDYKQIKKWILKNAMELWKYGYDCN